MSSICRAFTVVIIVLNKIYKTYANCKFEDFLFWLPKEPALILYLGKEEA